jgi:hypothetical protein
MKSARKNATAKKTPKITNKEVTAVKEQLGILIADATQTPPATHRPRPRPRSRRPSAIVDSAEPKKEPKAKAPTMPSTVENPVKVVHKLCGEMTKANPSVARKEIMAALLAKGINRHTASTQIQKWWKAQQAAK